MADLLDYSSPSSVPRTCTSSAGHSEDVEMWPHTQSPACAGNQSSGPERTCLQLREKEVRWGKGKHNSFQGCQLPMTKFSELFATPLDSSDLVAIIMVGRDWVSFKAFSQTFQKIYGGHVEQTEFTEFHKFTENGHPWVLHMQAITIVWLKEVDVMSLASSLRRPT